MVCPGASGPIPPKLTHYPPLRTRSAITEESRPTRRTVILGWRLRKDDTNSCNRQGDGALNVPSATPSALHGREGADAARGVLERLQPPGGMLGEGAAGVGWEDAASGPNKQVGSQRVLELADLLGHGGLRDP